jgi:hypothetical protein
MSPGRVGLCLAAHRGGAVKEEAPWWRKGTAKKFQETIDGFDAERLTALLAEMKGATAVIQGQLEAHGKADIEWWQRARQTLAYIAERKQLVKVRLTAFSHGSRSGKRERAERAMKLLDDGRHEDALREVIVLLQEMLK